MKTISSPGLPLQKGETHIIVSIIEYVSHSVVKRTIIRKTTGNITASSFDAGELLEATTSPYDCYIQIIDGAAELVIGNKTHQLRLGEGIVIPANIVHSFHAKAQFKMISTCIHSATIS